MEIPRSLIVFEESCKSEKTKYIYKKNLDRFLEWAHKDYESFLLLPKTELENLIQDYVIYLKQRISPNSFDPMISPIFKFLDIDGKEYSKKKIKSLFPTKVKTGGERAITDEELREMIRVAPTHKALAIIHVLAATGCRPEGISELQIKHIGAMPDGCMSLTIYPGSLHEYTTFLHPEATNALQKYHTDRKEKGEKILPETFVFRESRFSLTELNRKPMRPSTINRIVSGVMKKAEIKRIKVTSQRFDLATCTGIRKRFNTKLKTNPAISYAISEKLMAHKLGLESHYHKPLYDVN